MYFGAFLVLISLISCSGQNLLTAFTYMCFHSSLWENLKLPELLCKVSKQTKVRNRYNQVVPHRTQNTTWESDENTIKHHIQESKEVSPLPAGNHTAAMNPSADPEGGGGAGAPDPLGKARDIWVSIGNKQLDPPGKSWTPLENVGYPLEP